MNILPNILIYIIIFLEEKLRNIYFGKKIKICLCETFVRKKFDTINIYI